MNLIKATFLSLSILYVAPAYAEETVASEPASQEMMSQETEANVMDEIANVRDWWRNRCIRRCMEKYRECKWKGRPHTYCEVRKDLCVHDCRH